MVSRAAPSSSSRRPIQGVYSESVGQVQRQRPKRAHAARPRCSVESVADRDRPIATTEDFRPDERDHLLEGARVHEAAPTPESTAPKIRVRSDAPIFEHATYGIVDDLFEVCPRLTKAFETLS